MADIKVVAEDFDTTASELQGAIAKMEDSLREFISGYESTEEHWKGSSANVFMQTSKKIEKTLRSNIAKLEELKSDIQAAKVEFENTDTTSAKAF